MTRNLGVADVAWFVVAFEFAMLSVTGAAHVLRAPRGTALQHPRRVGLLELAIAGAVLAAALADEVRAVIATQALVVILSAVFVMFLMRLRRATDPRPCGCHPFAGSVANASFVPAGALGGAAVVLLAGATLERDVNPAGVVPGLVIAAVAALAAGVSLVYSGAAAAPMDLIKGE